ncbi:PadR family transcriptional regulator [Amorphus sp. 3PC139-8]|uniref:PadR family transcriptional regulator n=1 Tax=Amorphus sp. 3PC139-8 TaxID=2735676 RepID=UPI00345CA7A2
MNVRTLCLAILQHGDATGYEIKKMSVEGEYSYFVDASFGSIYPALSRLEADGLVTVREETQTGKPARKIYSVTEAGRAALVEALMAEPEEDLFRSPFLLVAMNAELLPRAHIAHAIDKKIDELEQEVAHLGQIIEAYENPGSRWIASYGLNCMTNSLRYLRAHRDALEALARDDATMPQSPLAVS